MSFTKHNFNYFHEFLILNKFINKLSKTKQNKIYLKAHPSSNKQYYLDPTLDLLKKNKHLKIINKKENFKKVLKENKLIPEDSIFIPGYAGDVLGGSQFLKVIPENLKQEQIADLVIRKKFSNYPLSKTEKKTIKNQVEQNLFHFDENYVKKIPSSVFEDYDIKEKIAKYIFNSANFYTFFGYEHRFPFWDKELLDLFKKVPVKYKNMKMLFNTVLINEYFKPNTVYFENELQPSGKSKHTQKIKDQIKPFLPTFVKQRFLQKNDWNNYKPITDQLDTLIVSKGLKVQKSSKDYNEIITQWYLYFSKNMI
jgi:asparagine synthase (glutamine-hydrolysing)